MSLLDYAVEQNSTALNLQGELASHFSTKAEIGLAKNGYTLIVKDGEATVLVNLSRPLSEEIKNGRCTMQQAIAFGKVLVQDKDEDGDPLPKDKIRIVLTKPEALYSGGVTYTKVSAVVKAAKPIKATAVAGINLLDA